MRDISIEVTNKINIIRDRFQEVELLNESQIETLIRNGYEHLVEIIDLETDQLSMLLEIELDLAEAILQSTDQAIIEQQERERLLKEQDIPKEAE